ncbi:hypothetical protein [Microcoleus sp. CAWBG58]|uniref:hypothetical protein n=1 Tax=Microcoleus sp. CAWBG58 TaxID=2841651 RepID=UPI0025EC132B|nr:hypothetical protein [Microcoleus sp. CAWBG58]
MIFLSVADWRSQIETMALLHPASIICLLAEFAARATTVRGAQKNGNGRSNKLNISRRHSRDAKH